MYRDILEILLETLSNSLSWNKFYEIIFFGVLSNLSLQSTKILCMTKNQSISKMT